MTPVTPGPLTLQVCSLSVEYGAGGLPVVSVGYMLFTPQGAPVAKGVLPSSAVSTESVAALQSLLKSIEADAVRYMGATTIEPAQPAPSPEPAPSEEDKPIAEFFTPRTV